MNPKDDVRKAVQAELSRAQDDLARAERAFGGLSAEELAKEHGQSGHTRQHFLDEYREEVQRWTRALGAV